MTHPLELIHLRNFKHLSEHIEALIRTRLWAKVLLGMLLGFMTGLIFGPELNIISRQAAETLGNWLVLPGNIFITLIQMIVVPLILASVVRGIAASGSVQQLKTLGLRLAMYFLFTTTIAVIIGISIASIVKPGNFVDIQSFAGGSGEQQVAQEVTEEVGEVAAPTLSQLPNAFISLLPDNPFGAAVELNMLQIVIFSIIFGLALISIPTKQSKPLLDLLGSLQSVVMRIIRWVMYLAPFAVFGFIAQITLQTGLETMYGIGMYILTVLAGLGLLIIVYMILVFIAARITPWQFLGAVREAQLLAFSTDSSVATMPVSMKVAEENLRVRPSISQFVMPIGATVNMDGTAVFQGAATLFLTQAYGIELGLGMLLSLIVTVIGASIGAPATPGVGIIILSVVLTGVGIPLEGLALIIGVDRVLELFRAVTNVTGDIVASVVMNRVAPGEKTYEEEAEYQKEVERIQKETGEDVITGEITPQTGGGFFHKLLHPFGG